MDIKIVKEKDTPLLSRKRVTIYAQYKGATPSRPELQGEIAKKLKTKPDLVVLRHIYTRFGQERSKIIVHIYNDTKTMVMLEGQALVDKHKPKGSAEKKQKESKEEKPSEEQPLEEANKTETEEEKEVKVESAEEKSKEDEPKEVKVESAEEKPKEEKAAEGKTKEEKSKESKPAEKPAENTEKSEGK